MGNPKVKWTPEEEEALKAGVVKHGAGKWKNIQKDPEFNHILHARSNIDLKDKWRNLTVAGTNLAPKEKPKTGVCKPEPVPVVENVVAPLAKVRKPPVAASSDVRKADAVRKTDAVVVETSKAAAERRDSARISEMVYEAISVLNEPNGSDFAAISDYIEQNHDVQPMFRRNLSRKLGRLVQQDKLEKVQKCYRIKSGVHSGTRTPAMNQKEIHHTPLHQVQSIMGVADNTVEAAAVAAAYRVAEAEDKSVAAAEAIRKAERVSLMAEEMDSILQFATYCFEQSAQGDLLLNASIDL